MEFGEGFRPPFSQRVTWDLVTPSRAPRADWVRPRISREALIRDAMVEISATASP